MVFGNGVQSTKTIVEGLLREAHVLAPNATLPYPGAPQSMLEIDSLELEYDARGNTSMRGIPHLGLEETFEHDPLGRLERWTTRSKGNVLQDDITQTYWETGAIRTRSDIGNYIYAGLQVLSAGGVSYTYDADGRQDSRAGFELDWTRRSRLRQSDDGSQVSTYTYDAFDSRAKRVETEQGSSTTTYYDELLEIEVSPSGEVQTFFVPGEDGRIAALKRDAGDEQLEVLYLHTNNLGSASVVTDANGLVVERRDFDPFGRQRPVTWASGDPIFAGEAELDLGFTGHREQEAHGLIDMRGRHYDPHLGRFASADPILAAPYSSQGHDPFAYVYNSPLRFVDPSGFIADPAADGPDSDPDAADYDDDNDWNPAGTSEGLPGDPADYGWVTVVEQGPAEPEGAALPDDSPGNANTPVAGGYDDAGDFEPERDGRQEAIAHIASALSFGASGRGLKRACSGQSCYEAVFSDGSSLDLQPDPDPIAIEIAIQEGIENNKGLEAAEFSAALSIEIVSMGVFSWGGRIVKLGRSACFTGDTLVHTSRGLLRIADLQPGDVVRSRDEGTGEDGWRRVVRLFEAENQVLLEIVVKNTLTSETIRVTPDHPLWSAEVGDWKSAGDVRVGDVLGTVDGTTNVVSVARVGAEDVYNIEVEGFHTYFVGEVGV